LFPFVPNMLRLRQGNWDTLICRAMVKKACSTFVAFLADVSRNGMPRPSANSYNQHKSRQWRPLRQYIRRLFYRSYRICFPQEVYWPLQLHNDQFLEAIVWHYWMNLHTSTSYNFERVTLICDIVNDDNSMSTTIIWRCNCTETFLSSSIPLLCQSRRMQRAYNL